MGNSALSKKSDEAGNLPTVTIYTDGSCLGNPGPGGYGAVLVTSQNGSSHRKEIYGGYRLTTNSRMEILAVLRALKELKVTFQVQIFSDSEYVVKSISKGWLERWSSEDWMAKPNKPRTDSDLWRRVYRLLKEHSVTISGVTQFWF